jgi:hypothetical protein
MSELTPTENTKNFNFSSSNIETIDAAFLEYVEKLNIFCTTNNGWSKVPVIWSSAERSFQIKNNPNMRDKNGSLILPIISLERVSINKDPNKKGNFQANLSPKNDKYYITKVLNQKATSKFANADSYKNNGQINFVTSKKNKKQVYQHLEVRIPIYVTVEYKINILTNYQSQMNEAMQPFMTKTSQNYFVISKDDHRYECFIDQQFSQDSINDLEEEERKYKSSITVKVLGYLNSVGENDDSRKININENAVELKLPKENIILDITDKKKKKKQIADSSVNEGNLISSGLAFKKTFLIGNGSDTQYVLNHNYGTRDLFVTMRENFGEYQKVEFFCLFQDDNVMVIDTGDPIPLNSYVIVLVG